MIRKIWKIPRLQQWQHMLISIDRQREKRRCLGKILAVKQFLFSYQGYENFSRWHFWFVFSALISHSRCTQAFLALPAFKMASSPHPMTVPAVCYLLLSSRTRSKNPVFLINHFSPDFVPGDKASHLPFVWFSHLWPGKIRAPRYFWVDLGPPHLWRKIRLPL